MKHIFDSAISRVQSAFPSVYTKEDVMSLIRDMQTKIEAEQEVKQPIMDLEALEQIKQSLLEGVRNISFEDCIELELSYDNRIEITVDDRAIANEIDECFEAAIEEVYPSDKK